MLDPPAPITSPPVPTPPPLILPQSRPSLICNPLQTAQPSVTVIRTFPPGPKQPLPFTVQQITLAPTFSAYGPSHSLIALKPVHHGTNVKTALNATLLPMIAVMLSPRRVAGELFPQGSGSITAEEKNVTSSAKVDFSGPS